uniref:transposase n=2 Tax=Prevotella nigrescens TaxID=28133 RepID=UPI0028801A61|nr:transposase [Prevotella nigrescens]
MVQSLKSVQAHIFLSLYKYTLYGHSYSRQQMSYLSNSCREDVGQWFNGPLSSHYSAVCIDATFIATRRDKQVSEEACCNVRPTNCNSL